ncbi:MAG: hypothetical protein HUU21_10000, partial [Polyangiaceae bacterium]|nr:hypothetical protein [Polyangiaceae bacterium]
GGMGGAGGDPSAGLYCVPKGNLGEPCQANFQCHSGHCIDSVCCNSACEAACQACNIVGNIGTCTPLGSLDSPKTPDPSHGTCTNQGTACGGFCNGTPPQADNPSGCIYPGTSTQNTEPQCSCADSPCVAGPTTLTTFPCNGMGGFDEVKTDCGGFRCASAIACGTTCSSDADCLEDFTCENAACVPLPTEGKCDGDHTIRVPGKADIDCTPYKCSGSACLTACDSVDQCVAPKVCRLSGACEDPATAPTPLGSCDCVAAGAPGKTSGAPLSLCLAALALASMRRRRRSIGQ